MNEGIWFNYKDIKEEYECFGVMSESNIWCREGSESCIDRGELNINRRNKNNDVLIIVLRSEYCYVVHIYHVYWTESNKQGIKWFDDFNSQLKMIYKYGFNSLSCTFVCKCYVSLNKTI